uniref:hypothetical protein n=1 Tax=Halococcus hamelinensis TaxID=332168 RepID=UPI0005D2A8A3
QCCQADSVCCVSVFLKAANIVEFVVTQATDVVVKCDVLVKCRCGSELFVASRTGVCHCDINSEVIA